MEVKIEFFSINKVENDVIFGSFMLEDYNYLGVQFKFENEELSFSCNSKNEEKINYFSKWLLKEKKFYAPIVSKYLNEIKKINKIRSFKGKLIEENSYEGVYSFHIQYDELPNAVNLHFDLSGGVLNVSYGMLNPTNFEKKYAIASFIDNVLEYETIKHMWEPFRDKTKYRLQLLHMLR